MVYVHCIHQCGGACGTFGHRCEFRRIRTLRRCSQRQDGMDREDPICSRKSHTEPRAQPQRQDAMYAMAGVQRVRFRSGTGSDPRGNDTLIDHDTGHLPLGISEWQAPLAAIERADDNDEAEWVEWKSTLDLHDKAHVGHVAKAIVAFANRDPATSAQRVEGRGLLIVGPAPGDVAGVPVGPCALRTMRRLVVKIALSRKVL